MKKVLILLILLIFLIGCGLDLPAEPTDDLEDKIPEEEGIKGLCSYDQCEEFCDKNEAQCEEYCKKDPQNKICKEFFLLDIEDVTSDDYCLKNSEECKKYSDNEPQQEEALSEEFCAKNQDHPECKLYYSPDFTETMEGSDDQGLGGLGPLCQNWPECEIFCDANPVKCQDFCTADTGKECAIIKEKYPPIDEESSEQFADAGTSPWVGEQPATVEILDPITIKLPFTISPALLIPLGETPNHPITPGGHPGIDFTWQVDQAISASADGQVTSLKLQSDNTWDLYLKHNQYFTRYEGLISTSFKVGDNVNQGTTLGRAKGIHWEFGADQNQQRARGPTSLCPLNYFDGASKKTIEQINAASTWEHKKDWPDICGGFYSGKNTLSDFLE
tara:strand:- start:10972 stop:12135 length:1164 start_codon:yes stop_codon:yes gene_type:complete